MADPPGADAIHNQLKIINAEILEVTRSTPTGGFPWMQLPEVMYTHWENTHDGYGDVNALACASIDDIQERFYHAYAPANLIVTVAADDLTEAEKTLSPNTLELSKSEQHIHRPSGKNRRPRQIVTAIAFTLSARSRQPQSG